MEETTKKLAMSLFISLEKFVHLFFQAVDDISSTLICDLHESLLQCAMARKFPSDSRDNQAGVNVNV